MVRTTFVSTLFIFFCCTGALQISSKDVSFASDQLETHLYFKKDSTLSSGISFSVQLSGDGAPSQVKPEDVLSVNGGKISVSGSVEQVTSGGASSELTTGNNDTVNMGSALRLPSMLMLVGFVGLVFGVRSSATLSVFSLALLLGSAYALTLRSDWVLTVTVSVPENYNMDSLSINIASGSVTSDSDMGTTVGRFSIDMCQGNALNQVVLDGFTFGTSANVCATDKVWMNSVTGLNMNVQSKTDSAQVFLKSTFAYAYELTCESGYALSTPCMTPTVKTLTTKHIVGDCGSASSTITISAKHNAILAKAEDTSVVGMKRWSDASTWGSKGVPTAGSDVTIAQDQVILLDAKTAALGLLDVRGTLIADPNSDFWVTADAIEVRGMLRVGWLSSPYMGTGGFTLTGKKGNYTSRAPYGAFTNDGQSRGFRFFSSSIMEMHGDPPKTVYTRLNADAYQNDTTITVDAVLGWNVGDLIAISPTTFPSTSSTDFRTIRAINNVTKQVTLDQGLSYGRFGRMQYMTDNGISFTPGTFDKLKAHPEVPTTLDERAVIIHLTRNIVVEGANDTEWANGHGAHFMWMGSMTAQLDGVEFRRAGQAGAIGRYAVHAHMQSYSMPDGMNWPALSNGVYIGDADRTFVRNIAVHESKNRAVAIHGTCGARYINNVAGDILGHAYFFEDGSEIRNHFVGNVGLNVKKPIKSNELLKTDAQSAGVWLSNGNNVVRDNIFGDIPDGIGLWNAIGQNRQFMEYANITVPSGITFARTSPFDWSYFLPVANEKWVLTAKNSTTWSVVGDKTGQLADATAGKDYSGSTVFFKISGSATVGSQIKFSINASGAGCLGQSKWVDLWPYYTNMYVYENNTGFACGRQGAKSDDSAVDDFGNTVTNMPVSMNDSRPGSQWDTVRRSETLFNGSRLWMNAMGAYQNRILFPFYRGWTVADNMGTDLTGAVQYGLVANFLFVGNSLNTLEKSLYTKPRHAVASYHFGLAFHNLTFFNYPDLPNNTVFTTRNLVEVPGLIETWDLYLNAIELGPSESQYGLPGLMNWKTFNTTAFERCPPPNIEYLYGPQFKGPDLPRQYGDTGRYWTHSGALWDTEGILSGRAKDYIIFDHPFLTYNLTNKRIIGRPGISKTAATSDKFAGMTVAVTDDEASYPYVGQIWSRLDDKYQYVANWTIKDGRKSNLLGYMRHAGGVNGGRYKLVMENGKVWQKNFVLQFTNTNEIGNELIIAFPWSGAVTPQITLNNKQMNSTHQVTSMSQLESTGPSYMIDAANNQIWYHHRAVAAFPSGKVIRVEVKPKL